MTKKDIVQIVATRTNLSKVQAERAVEVVVETFTDTLKKGGKIFLPGLGTLHVIERAARAGRNPQTGEAIQIPATRVAKFRSAKALKEALKR